MKHFLLALVAVPHFALAGQAHKVVSGSCRIETIAEVIELVNLDPYTRYGVFAEGFSKRGDRVYLTHNPDNAISINIQGRGGDSYAIVPKAKRGLTDIRVGLLVDALTGDPSRRDWLSCDLKVR